MGEINILEILGKNMHDLRFAKNISIKVLAEKVNIDIETLTKFEAGIYTGLKITQYGNIANCLGVSIKEMTKGIEFLGTYIFTFALMLPLFSIKENKSKLYNSLETKKWLFFKGRNY